MEGQPPPQGAEPTPAPEPSPYETWFKQSGIDPDQVQPLDAHKALNMFYGVQNPNFWEGAVHEIFKTGPSQQWYPEHWTPQDLQRVVQEAARREGMPDPNEFYDPQAGMFDPNAFLGQLPQIIQAQVSQSLQQERARLEQDLSTRDMANAMWDLTRSFNLTPQDQAIVGTQADALRQQGMAPREAVQQAWQQLQTWRANGHAQQVTQQAQAPQMGLPGGATPHEHQGAPRTFREAVNRTWEGG